MGLFVSARNNAFLYELPGAHGSHFAVNAQVFQATVGDELGYMPRNRAYAYLKAVSVPE